MRVVIDIDAQAEATEAAVFYEHCRPGLGHDFTDAVEEGLKQITQRPLLWRRFKGRFRRYILRRFPYAIIYAIEPDRLYVAAVMHMKRKPDYWLARISERANEYR